MKEQIINNLGAVINALNTVTVCGRDNLGNLSGSIAVLESIQRALAGVEIVSGDSAPHGAHGGATSMSAAVEAHDEA